MEIKQYQSPNKMSRNGWKPDIIVFHISDGYFESGIGWLCNPTSQASSNFFISKMGEIAQLVDIKDAAWCNGTSIKTANGVEDNKHYSHSTSYFVRDRKTNANYYTISVECEGFYKDTRGELTDKQLEAAIWLVGYIKEQVKEIYGTELPLDREHILGHYEVNPITKPNCPGEDFQFEEIVDFYNKKEVTEEEEEMKETRYATVAEMPEDWAQKPIQRLMDEGYIADTRNLDLSMDMIRTLVIMSRIVIDK